MESRFSRGRGSHKGSGMGGKDGHKTKKPRGSSLVSKKALERDVKKKTGKTSNTPSGCNGGTTTNFNGIAEKQDMRH